MIKLDQTIINNIIHSYQEDKLSPRKIEKIYKISRTTIIKILKENNVKIRSGKQRSFFNENYFEKIDTEAKAYLLGFILADGCIYQPKDSQLSLSLQLQSKDIEILELLKKETQSDKQICYITTRNMISFSLTSNKLCQDLQKLNITPNKTFTATFPPMELIPENLIRHFIRGLFDGDGCISGILPLKRKEKRFRFDICGTLNICKFLKLYLSLIVDPSDKNTIVQQGKIYRLIYNKKQSLENLFNYLYKNSSIFLKRKYNKFNEFILSIN